MSPGKKASFSLPAKMVPAWYLLSDFPTCSSSPPHPKYITFYLVRPGNTDISSQWVPYFLLLVPSVPGKVLCWKETLVVPLLLSLSLFLPFLPAVLKQQMLANLTFSSEVLASNPNHQKSLEKRIEDFWSTCALLWNASCWCSLPPGVLFAIISTSASFIWKCCADLIRLFLAYLSWQPWCIWNKAWPVDFPSWDPGRRYQPVHHTCNERGWTKWLTI